MKNRNLKIFAILFIAVIALFGLATKKSEAATQTVDGITYTYSVANSEATITAASGVGYSTPSPIVIPSTLGGYSVTKIGNGSSKVFSSLYNKSVTIPDTVKEIANYAFQSCYYSGDLVIPDSVERIGNYAFSSNGGLGYVTLGNGNSHLTYIGAYAFQGTYGNSPGGKGDLTIPDSVTVVGMNAFKQSGFDGTLTIGSGLKVINMYAFQNMKKLKKLVIGPNVATINNNGIEGGSFEVFVRRQEGTVTIRANNNDTNGNPYVYHWLGDTHNLKVVSAPGVHIINTSNNQEITSGDYACETVFNVRLDVDSSYNYDNMKIIYSYGENYSNYEVFNYTPGETVTLPEITKDTKIAIQVSETKEKDLVLRTFATKINHRPLDTSRAPTIGVQYGAVSYEHTKRGLQVSKDDIVTYIVRVYNEGSDELEVSKINVFLPEGLEFAPGDIRNVINGWSVDQNDSTKLISEKLAGNIIEGYQENYNPSYLDLELNLKVTKDRVQEVSTKLKMIAEIAEVKSHGEVITSDDDNATFGNITAAVDEDYKEPEASASTSLSYIKGTEEDDDFECVALPGKAKVTYDLHLRKTDIANEELLEGATFRLYNDQKEKITDADTDENGEINFGTMTSYGEGQDIYYIEEIVPPAGYAEVEQCKIKVIVNKTMIDEVTGQCAISIVCEKSDYTVNTSRYEFIPISNVQQLKKIGSGDTITIDGEDYVFATDANYKLMADIDLSGEEWTPIENEIVGIFDGNGKKIIGLTITSTSDYNKSEVGLFRVFSGIFENTTFENVNININNFANDAANISGKTGVGTIAGVMKEGVIYNVTVSGTVTANVDNVGGFVGHTMPERIVRAIKCTNNASVSGTKNVGGVIGCSLGAISIVNSTSAGTVIATNNWGNAGGLVGYVETTDYQETLFTGAYKEDDESNLFTLVARNEELEDGTYKILLENRDKITRNLIPNGVYTVYDSNKSVITGLENITLTDGTADLGTYTFDTVGKTTYYLKENSPATGYRPLTKYIKVVVTRAWDGEDYKFYVTVEDVLLSDAEFNNDVPEDSSVEVNPRTGKTNEITEHEDVYWNVNKAEFIDCKNTANMGDENTYHVGGLLGTACKCHVEFDNCTNSGTITGKKAGGLASMITCHSYSDGTTKIDDNWSKVIKCTNNAVINGGNGMESGGLIAETNGNIKVYNSSNSGSVTASNSFVGGIIGRVCGKTNVVSCRNTGVLNSNTKSHDAVVGGIIGGEGVSYELYHDFADMELLINDCTNTADIISKFHSAGIIGLTNSDNCIITNCTVGNADGDKISIKTLEGDIGGIVASIHAKKTTIRNCNVDNTDMIVIGGNEDTENGTYGDIGGIVGVLYNFNGNSQTGYNKACEIVIDKCNVSNSTIADELGVIDESNRAGIIAQMYSSRELSCDLNAYITDCNVKNTDISNTYIDGSIYSTAGIVGISYGTGVNTEIENCLVKECSITSTNNKNTSVSDVNTAGIMAASYCNSIKIVNCDVNKTNITNARTLSQINDNAGGIIAYSENEHTEITDCNVTNRSKIIGHQGNIGGILGHTAKETVIERCTFEDGTLISDGEIGGNQNSGGIAGQKAGTSTTKIAIRDCKVDNVNMDVQTCNTGGILGYSMHDGTIIENCTVNKTNITEDYRYTNGGSLGGIGGNIRGEHIINCTVSDCNLKSLYLCQANGGIVGYNGVQLIDNCKVKGGTIESDVTAYPAEDSILNAFVTAGFSAISGNAITNSSVEDTTVKGVSRVSGFIGYGGGTVRDNTISGITLVGNNAQDTVENGQRTMAGVACESSATFENVKVNGITATGNIETFGGFVGGSSGTFKNCSVKNLNVTVSDVKSSSWGAVGGFAGHLYSNARLENVDVDTATIDVDEHVVGGLIGEVITYKTPWGNEYDSNVYVVDSKVKDATITHKNSKVRTNDGLVGGLVGTNTERGKINAIRCKVIDCNLTGNEVSGSTSKLHMGGIIGFVNGENSFTNCEATRTAITNNTTGMTGGVAGMTQYNPNSVSVTERTLILNDVTVDGGTDTVTISGKSHVGGILGFGKMSITTPVTVKNIVLKTFGTTGDEEVHEVIGVATDHTGESDVTVENVTIE